MKANNLIIDSISKTYKKGKIRANDNISLELYPSEITALIGHNGAGKTTLLNQIIGNAKPDSGDITYKGISLVKNSKNARKAPPAGELSAGGAEIMSGDSGAFPQCFPDAPSPGGNAAG